MAIIEIDKQKFETDNLNDKAKNQVALIQFIDNKIKELHAELATFQTARNAYVNALKSSIKGN